MLPASASQPITDVDVRYLAILFAGTLLLLLASLLRRRRCADLPLPQSVPLRTTPELRGGSIGILPSEVLEVIFKNFRKRPLIHVVSLVCRRWRRVALRLVTHLRLYLHCGALLAQPLFAKTPRLTSIALASSNEEDGPRHKVAIPPTVTRLRNESGSSYLLKHALTLPPLKKLRLASPGSSFLFSHSLSTLQSLHMSGVLSSALGECLSYLHMPALTAITLGPLWGDGKLMPFLAQHASQLTKLKLACLNGSSDALVALPLTRLRGLSLTETDLSAAQLERLLSAATNLGELKVVNVPAIFNVPHAILTSLVSLATNRMSQFPPEAYKSLTRLRSYRLGMQMCPQNLLWRLTDSMQRIITNISLDIEDRAAVAQLSHLLRHTPMLEKLYLICHLTILQLTAAGQRLPALRLVHFTYLNAVNLRTYTFEDIVRPLRCLLVPASALKRVHLTVKGVHL